MRSRLLAVALGLAAPLALAPVAAAAPPPPFGHSCTPQNGVLFCPTAELPNRVPSWDGTPLDVDVTLPPTGDGPFPTLVMEHGYPGTKATWQATAPEGNNGVSYHYNNAYFAQQGYAVVNLSARGFGRSCGVPESRTAGCERGWTHIADHRFEARDVQHLLGLLVDQRVARPDALGVTGLSGGGGRSVGLAFLRDSVRQADGSLAPWRSPAGTPLRIAAAYPRWAWEDLTTALVPNGRLADDRVPAPGASRSPLGVAKRRWLDLLYVGGNSAGFVAPPGADDQADLTNWRDATMQEPYGADVKRIGDLLSTYIGGAAGLAGRTPAPMIIGQGWTDELFPADEALRIAERARAAGADVSLLLGNIGHGWAGNPARVDREFNDAAAAFLAQRLQPGAATFNPGVTLWTSACPKGSAGRRMAGDSLEEIQRGRIVIRGRAAKHFDWRGGRAATAQELDGTTGDWCEGVRTRRERNAASYEARSRGVTLVGTPTITATVRASGPSGQIAARLWDAGRRRQRLIARGVYRLTDDQRGRITFRLHPNAYRFARGNRIRLELLGRDAPYAQAPTRAFSVRVSRLKLELPVRERPSRRLGVVR
jgi:dienelactone hydrolase